MLRAANYRSDVISGGPSHSDTFVLATKRASYARSCAARLSGPSLLHCLYFLAHCTRRGCLGFILGTPFGRRGGAGANQHMRAWFSDIFVRLRCCVHRFIDVQESSRNAVFNALPSIKKHSLSLSGPLAAEDKDRRCHRFLSWVGPNAAKERRAFFEKPSHDHGHL